MKFKMTCAALSALMMTSQTAHAGFLDSFKKSYKESYNASFLKHFRTSFVKSCVGGDAEEAKRLICECCADGAVSQMTVEQLKSRTAVEHIKTAILPGCVEKNTPR